MTYDIDKIVHYLEPLKDKVSKLYQWKIKTDTLEKLVRLKICSQEEIDELSDKDNFAKNVALKQLLAIKFAHLSSVQDKQFKDLSLWVIKDWGGIRSGDDKKVMQRIEDLLKGKCSFERIASTSKVASFKNPSENIIYDSRVAYTLNWIILSENAGDKFFPMPNGRNSKLKAFDIEMLIRQKNIAQYQIEDTAELNKRFISNKDKALYLNKDEAYDKLNQLIKVVNKKLWYDDKQKVDNLYYTEMLLFAIADSEIYKDITVRIMLNITEK